MAESVVLDRWDDELTQLTERVRERFGNAALGEAMKRALAVAQQERRPVPLDSLAAEVLPTDAATSAIPVYAALRAELKRLLTPQ